MGFSSHSRSVLNVSDLESDMSSHLEKSLLAAYVEEKWECLQNVGTILGEVYELIKGKLLKPLACAHFGNLAILMRFSGAMSGWLPGECHPIVEYLPAREPC